VVVAKAAAVTRALHLVWVGGVPCLRGGLRLSAQALEGVPLRQGDTQPCPVADADGHGGVVGADTDAGAVEVLNGADGADCLGGLGCGDALGAALVRAGGVNCVHGSDATPDRLRCQLGSRSELCNHRDMQTDEPDEMDRRLSRARKRYDDAHGSLLAAVREALAEGRRPSRIARHVGWSREYIAKIRDGKTGRRTP
jgi:hypothetical protein